MGNEKNKSMTRKNYLWLIIVWFLWETNSVRAQHWQAPADAANVQNPVKPTEQSIQNGQQIYQRLCVACHGINGDGNGPAAAGLNPKPANFHAETFRKQTDGEIFWKLSHGRGAMAGYQNMLSEKERWDLVNYLRSLTQANKAATQVNTSTQKTEAEKNVNHFPFAYSGLDATTTLIPKGKMAFIIQHRFGAVTPDESALRNFLGLDLAANTRLALGWGLTRRLSVEVGHTRYGKFYDLTAGYDLSPWTGPKIRSIFYGSVAVMTDRFTPVSDSARFADGRPFAYTFAHRLYYDARLLFSYALNRWAFQAGLQVGWRNLAPPDEPGPGGHGLVRETNLLWALPVMLRYRSGLRSAWTLNITPTGRAHTLPFALSYEIVSSGNHLFSITLSNTDRILPVMQLSRNHFRPGKDGLLLGFNIIRYF